MFSKAKSKENYWHVKPEADESFCSVCGYLVGVGDLHRVVVKGVGIFRREILDNRLSVRSFESLCATLIRSGLLVLVAVLAIGCGGGDEPLDLTGTPTETPEFGNEETSCICVDLAKDYNAFCLDQYPDRTTSDQQDCLDQSELDFNSCRIKFYEDCKSSVYPSA